MSRVLADPFAQVTFSGGDPMFQPEGFTEVAAAIKARSQKTIWCYTGYRYEELLRHPQQAQLLRYIDVLALSCRRCETRACFSEAAATND